MKHRRWMAWSLIPLLSYGGFAKQAEPILCASLAAPGDPARTAATLAYLRLAELVARERLIGPAELTRIRDAEVAVSPWGDRSVLQPEKMGHHTVFQAICRNSELEWPKVRQWATGFWADMKEEERRKQAAHVATAAVVGLRSLGKMKVPAAALAGPTHYQKVFYSQGRPYGLFVHASDNGIYLVDLRAKKFLKKTEFKRHPTRVSSFEHHGRVYGVTYTQEYGTRKPEDPQVGKPVASYKIEIFDPFTGRKVNSVETARSAEKVGGFGTVEWGGKAYAVSGGFGRLALVELNPDEPKLTHIQGASNVPYDEKFYSDTFGKFVRTPEGKVYFVFIGERLDDEKASLIVFDLQEKKEIRKIRVGRKLSSAFEAFYHSGKVTALVFGFRGGGDRVVGQRAMWVDLLTGETLAERAYRASDDPDHDPAVFLSDDSIQFMADADKDFLFGDIVPAQGTMHLDIRPSTGEGNSISAHVALETENHKLIIQGLHAHAGMNVIDLRTRTLLPAGGRFDDDRTNSHGIHPKLFWDRGEPYLVAVGGDAELLFFALGGKP